MLCARIWKRGRQINCVKRAVFTRTLNRLGSRDGPPKPRLEPLLHGGRPDEVSRRKKSYPRTRTHLRRNPSKTQVASPNWRARRLLLCLPQPDATVKCQGSTLADEALLPLGSLLYLVTRLHMSCPDLRAGILLFADRGQMKQVFPRNWELPARACLRRSRLGSWRKRSRGWKMNGLIDDRVRLVPERGRLCLFQLGDGDI